MVAKPNRLAEARRAIQQALTEMVKAHDGSRVQIKPNEWGHLNVVVGSDRFRDMRDDDREDLVWRHLRESLSPSDFGQLSELTVLDNNEYEGLLELDETVNRLGGGREDIRDDISL